VKSHPDYALPFGANCRPDGHVCFRLWAPTARTVALAINRQKPEAMQADGAQRGWFELTLKCAPGSAYRYHVCTHDDDVIQVPNPAARAQQGGIDDPSLVVDPHAYRWHNAGWRGRPWHEAVLYELHVGAMGGFAAVTQRLPALAHLGVTAIELMPVAAFPGANNWGYDGVLAFAPDATYGTPEQLKALIDKAHGLGLMVFLDVVYNHLGPVGNYLASYAAPFMRDDIDTLWGQTIDFRVAEVREFFTQNALYWLLEYRFDGLRLDAAHAISEQDWLPEMAMRVRRTLAALAPQRHVHLVMEHDDNAAHLLGKAFNAQWNDDGHHVLHQLLTGERNSYYADYARHPAEMLARCLAEGFIYQGEPSEFRHGQPRGESSAALAPTAFVLFLQNHDQIGNRALGERLTNLVDPRALHAAQALVLLCPQIPLLFMGEEVNSILPFFYFTSHEDSEIADSVRAGRLDKFSDQPEFAQSEQQEQIPDPNDERTFTHSSPVLPSIASSALLRQLLAIRRAKIIPRLQHARALYAQVLGPGAVCAHWRMGDDTRLVIWINLGQQAVFLPREAPLPTMDSERLFASHGASAALARGELPALSLIALLEPALAVKPGLKPQRSST